MEIVGPQQEVPNGVSVLAVANDITLVDTIQQMCLRSRYRFTTCPHGLDAFNLLSKSKDSFDVILVDDHLPDMDGYDFLQHVKEIMNIPVIMTSVDETPNSVMKAMKYGACDYWIKPLQQERFRNIWQHVARTALTLNNERKRMKNNNEIIVNHDAAAAAIEEEGVVNANNNAQKEEINTSKRDEKENYPPAKKTRIVWSRDLHAEFVTAVTRLGVERAVPKKILALMNDSRLTREHIASHLQKYRIRLKKIAEAQQNGGVVLPPAVPSSSSSSTGHQHFPFQMPSSSIQCPNPSSHAGEQTMLPYGNIPQLSSNVARNNNDNILMMIQDGPTSSKYGGGRNHSANMLVNAMAPKPQPQPSMNIYQFNSYNAAAVNPNCNMKLVSHHDQGNNGEAAGASSAVSANQNINYSWFGGWNSNNNNNPSNSQVFGYINPPLPLQIQVPFPNGANLMISPSPAGLSQHCSSKPAAARLEIMEPSSVSGDQSQKLSLEDNFNFNTTADQEDLHSIINPIIDHRPFP